MRTILRAVFFPALLLIFASSAYADTITLNSGSGNTNSHLNGALAYLGYSSLNNGYQSGGLSATGNPQHLSNSAQTSYLVTNPGPWAGAIAGTSWVSNSAMAGASCSGSQCEPNDFYYYETSFDAVGGVYDGSISVMADDTAEVLLNGEPIVPFGTIGSDTKCAAGSPNCRSVDTVTLSGISLKAGMNTLSIIDAQTGAGGEGVDFSAEFIAAQTPEPASLLLMGSGFFGLALALFWRSRASRMPLRS
ncbi:MAG: PEP-CTERM sorting domain-containing protein [Terracidiphilus sp.]